MPIWIMLHILLLLSPPWFPAATITPRWAPVGYIVAGKVPYSKAHEQVPTARWRGIMPFVSADHIPALQGAIILSPYLWKPCILDTPITSWSSTRDPRSIAPMHEP